MSRLTMIGAILLMLAIWAARPLSALEVTRVKPAPDSVVEELSPTLYIYFVSARGEEVDAEKLRLFLNGSDVTWKCLVVTNCISCQPSYRFPEGKNTIKFVYEGEKSLEYEWSFTVKSTGNPQGELSHNGTDQSFQEGDILEVELKSVEGGIARFSIGDWKQDIPMEEVSPGVYRGACRIERMDSAKNQTVSARLRTGGGKILEFQSDRKITISAYFFKVKILSPENDSVVDNYFDITGRTRPNSKVSLAPQMTFTGGIGANPGNMGAIEVMADEKGYFKVHYGIPIKIGGMQLSFLVMARDTDGNLSLPVSFSVKIK